MSKPVLALLAVLMVLVISTEDIQKMPFNGEHTSHYSVVEHLMSGESKTVSSPIDVSIVRIIDSSGPQYDPKSGPGKVIDGDPKSYWRVNIPDGRYHNNWYITFELKMNYYVVGLKLRNYGDTIHDISRFKLEASDDKVNWKMGGSKKGIVTGTNDWQSFDGFTATGKYLRFTITKTHSGWHPWLAEVRFTGYPILIITNTKPTTTIKPKKTCFYWGPSKTNQDNCKLPWAKFGDSCLLLSSNFGLRTFDEARECCKFQHEEAELVIPTDLIVLKKYLLKKKSPLAKQSLWVGGSDTSTPGEPRWLDGSAIDRSLWFYGKPLMKNKGNQCVVVDMTKVKIRAKTCTEEYRFICEKFY